MKLLALTLVAIIVAVEARTLSRRDLKTDLISRGQTLIKQADEAVAKLTGAQKVHELSIVHAEQAELRRLILALESAPANHEQSIRRLEAELARAERALAAEIAKIEKLITPELPTNPVIDN